EDPKPFTWTKDADEILNSLAKYIARISGAGHYRPWHLLSLCVRQEVPLHTGPFRENTDE
ncbi:hypothetical protein ACWD7C_40810, partial [Streptomyces sp. NPDC005134]|uniref:hypothetical protein n=1 Tax=Streptomyces sp. NPDC005098 TaxID=3154560 RepID=UPI0033AA68F8